MVMMIDIMAKTCQYSNMPTKSRHVITTPSAPNTELVSKLILMVTVLLKEVKQLFQKVTNMKLASMVRKVMKRRRMSEKRVSLR